MEGKTKTKNLKEEPTMSNLIETKKVNITKKREINWANVWLFTGSAIVVGALGTALTIMGRRVHDQLYNPNWKPKNSEVNDYSYDETEMDESNED